MQQSCWDMHDRGRTRCVLLGGPLRPWNYDDSIRTGLEVMGITVGESDGVMPVEVGRFVAMPVIWNFLSQIDVSVV